MPHQPDRDRDYLIVAIVMTAVLCTAAMALLLVAVWVPCPLPLLVLMSDAPIIAIVVTMYLAARYRMRTSAIRDHARRPADLASRRASGRPVQRGPETGWVPAGVGERLTFTLADVQRIAGEAFAVGRRVERESRHFGEDGYGS